MSCISFQSTTYLLPFFVVTFCNLPNQSITSFSSSCQMLLFCHFLWLVFSFISANPLLPCLRAPISYCAMALPVHICGPMRGAVTSPWHVLLFHILSFHSLLSHPTASSPNHIYAKGSQASFSHVSSHTRDPSSLTWQTCSESSTSLVSNHWSP